MKKAINSDKSDIRKHIKKIRNAIPQEYSDMAQQTIFNRISHITGLAEKTHILCYVSYSSEVSTLRFIDEALHCNGKHIYVPRVEGNHIMNFYEIHDMSTELVTGAYGIPEPVASATKFPDNVPDREALMIVPGLAFDADCNRIGYGGGFYDTYLAMHPDMLKVAVAFDCQIIDSCPDVEVTDIKPDIIVTEKRVIERR